MGRFFRACRAMGAVISKPMGFGFAAAVGQSAGGRRSDRLRRMPSGQVFQRLEPSAAGLEQAQAPDDLQSLDDVDRMTQGAVGQRLSCVGLATQSQRDDRPHAHLRQGVTQGVQELGVVVPRPELRLIPAANRARLRFRRNQSEAFEAEMRLSFHPRPCVLTPPGPRQGKNARCLTRP